MSITDELLQANERYAQGFNQGQLAMPPARRVAIVACMDARLTIEPMLGLKTGDAHIIRNAGGIVNDETVRSLLISHYLLGTQEFLIINHTDCGMLTFKDEDLMRRLEKESGTAAVAPQYFHAFPNLEENVQRQIQRLRAHPWIPEQIPVRGFIYDVKTGKLREVKAGSKAVAA